MNQKVTVLVPIGNTTTLELVANMSPDRILTPESQDVIHFRLVTRHNRSVIVHDLEGKPLFQGEPQESGISDFKFTEVTEFVSVHLIQDDGSSIGTIYIKYLQGYATRAKRYYIVDGLLYASSDPISPDTTAINVTRIYHVETQPKLNVTPH